MYRNDYLMLGSSLSTPFGLPIILLESLDCLLVCRSIFKAIIITYILASLIHVAFTVLPRIAEVESNSTCMGWWGENGTC
jgi:hypothetical protein